MLSLLALLGVSSNFHRGVYLVVFSLAVGIAACWFGITAMRKARLSASNASGVSDTATRSPDSAIKLTPSRRRFGPKCRG